MPEKPLTIATYAAGASLTAITLVYVFGPTFFIDGDAASSASTRKRGVVGLANPANDCFINSVLQAVAGLGDLRLYLIRETHRRKLDGPEVYAHLVEDPGLKDILDALNERPLYKKTISAAEFVRVLEQAFKQRISRQQQDAQEFLQVVAERLCDEYHAGHRVRHHARTSTKGDSALPLNEEPVDESLNRPVSENDKVSESALTVAGLPTEDNEGIVRATNGGRRGGFHVKNNEEDGFPLEGGSESQIECLTCGFKPKATKTTFCSLTLSVPQVSSTSLSSCFDQMFKTEYIEDFKCEKCRLLHALEWLQQEMSRSNSEKFISSTQAKIDRLQKIIENDPEEEIKDFELPDTKFAPKRKIAKHVRITEFPKVMAIHLSRSIFDVGRSTMKNSAKISFPEQLPLGGLLNQRMYKLSSVVCHKGSHHSGHYESFRRQVVYAPFATQNPFQVSEVYSKPAAPSPSQLPTNPATAAKRGEDGHGDTNIPFTPEKISGVSAASSSVAYKNGTPSGESLNRISSSVSTTSVITTKAPESTSVPRDPETGSLRSIARSAKSTLSKIPSSIHRSSPPSSPSASLDSKISTLKTTSAASTIRRKRNPSNRWWRISDEKVRECKTGEVLGMQREVYMLFYELETKYEEM